MKPLWQRTDPEIARDAVHELESHVSIPADRIKVTVKDGRVTLEGTVDFETPETSGLIPMETESIKDSLKQVGETPASSTTSTAHSAGDEGH